MNDRNGFKQICDNPKLLQLMTQIEENIVALNAESRLYHCECCQDIGVELTTARAWLGYETEHASGCDHCIPGAHIQRQQARFRFKRKAVTPATDTRKLTSDERESALRGDFSFLDGAA